MLTLAKILYIASVLRARPRSIDRYIDYFGERASRQTSTSESSEDRRKMERMSEDTERSL